MEHSNGSTTNERVKTRIIESAYSVNCSRRSRRDRAVLGISQTIKLAGPSVLLGYAIAGIIAFLIMRHLGEMVVEEPVSGSFSYFANKYWGPMAGFMSGWNYWVLYVLVSMAELSAIGTFVQFWLPELPTWITALFSLLPLMP